MPDSYELHDIRLVQYLYNFSAANADALTIGAPGVPNGKLWTVTGFAYLPDVAETQTIAIEKYNSGSGNSYAILNPVSLALQPARCTFISEGMLYTLFPGEYINIRRGNHTAGSVMLAYMQFIETDLPLYEYIEPQIKRSIYRASSNLLRRAGGGGRPPAGIAPPTGPTGGGGGRER